MDYYSMAVSQSDSSISLECMIIYLIYPSIQYIMHIYHNKDENAWWKHSKNKTYGALLAMHIGSMLLASPWIMIWQKYCWFQFTVEWHLNILTGKYLYLCFFQCKHLLVTIYKLSHNFKSNTLTSLNIYFQLSKCAPLSSKCNGTSLQCTKTLERL